MCQRKVWVSYLETYQRTSLCYEPRAGLYIWRVYRMSIRGRHHDMSQGRVYIFEGCIGCLSKDVIMIWAKGGSIIWYEPRAGLYIWRVYRMSIRGRHHDMNQGLALMCEACTGWLPKDAMWTSVNFHLHRRRTFIRPLFHFTEVYLVYVDHKRSTGRNR